MRTPPTLSVDTLRETTEAVGDQGDLRLLPRRHKKQEDRQGTKYNAHIIPTQARVEGAPC